jgi:hypothetical protein
MKWSGTARYLSLVKYDYDSFPEDWKKKNPNIYEGFTFCKIGEIPNMPGHCLCLRISGNPLTPHGEIYIFHPEDLIELTEDET